jgi:GNAT superfamily N-acetyltransferase
MRQVGPHCSVFPLARPGCRSRPRRWLWLSSQLLDANGVRNSILAFDTTPSMDDDTANRRLLMALLHPTHGPMALYRRLAGQARLRVTVPTQSAVLQVYRWRHHRHSTVTPLGLTASAARIEVLDHIPAVSRWVLRMWIGGVFEWTEEYAPFDYHVIAHVGSQRIGHVGIVDRIATVDGSEARAGLVGGVYTDPRLRNQGLGTRLMVRARDVMVDLDMEYGILMCLSSLVPFYERVGWKVFDGPLIFDRGWGPQTSPLRVMVLSLKSADGPGGLINVNGFPA